MPERFDRERRAQPEGDAARFVERREDRPVPLGIGDDGHGGVILRCRPDQCGPADVDLLDELVERGSLALGRGGERVQIDDHELERRDPGREQRLAVLLPPTIGEDAGVDRRVKRLDAPVEDLAKARHRAHVGDRQACVPQGARRTAGRHELEAPGDQPPSEVDQPRLVTRRQERTPGRRQRRIGLRGVQPNVAPLDRHHVPGEQQRNRPRQQAVLRRSNPVVQARFVVVRGDRDGLLEHDRAAVQRRVHEVDRAARDADAVGEGVANGVPTRKRRQEGRVRVQDATVERREDRRSDDAHVPRERDDVDRGGARASARAPRRRRPARLGSVAARPGSSAVSIPCSAAQARAGQSRSANTSEISPPSSPRPAAATSARRLLPAPETPTATRPLIEARPGWPPATRPGAGLRHTDHQARPLPRPRRRGSRPAAPATVRSLPRGRRRPPSRVRR